MRVTCVAWIQSRKLLLLLKLIRRESFLLEVFFFAALLRVNFVHFWKQLIGYLHFCEASRMEFPPENMVGVLLKEFKIWTCKFISKIFSAISTKLFKSNIDLRIPKLQHPHLKAPSESADLVKMIIPNRPATERRQSIFPPGWRRHVSFHFHKTRSNRKLKQNFCCTYFFTFSSFPTNQEVTFWMRETNPTEKTWLFFFFETHEKSSWGADAIVTFHNKPWTAWARLENLKVLERY